jgi:hypothetical protein
MHLRQSVTAGRRKRRRNKKNPDHRKTGVLCRLPARGQVPLSHLNEVRLIWLMRGEGRPSKPGSLAMLAAIRGASALILQSKARSDDIEELGADLMAVPPDHLVSAFPHHTITGQKQHKFIRSVETVEEEPHTAVGDIDYEAVARRNSSSDLDLRYTVEAMTRRAASLLMYSRAQ